MPKRQFSNQASANIAAIKAAFDALDRDFPDGTFKFCEALEGECAQHPEHHDAIDDYVNSRVLEFWSLDKIVRAALRAWPDDLFASLALAISTAQKLQLDKALSALVPRYMESVHLFNLGDYQGTEEQEEAFIDRICDICSEAVQDRTRTDLVTNKVWAGFAAAQGQYISGHTPKDPLNRVLMGGLARLVNATSTLQFETTRQRFETLKQ